MGGQIGDILIGYRKNGLWETLFLPEDVSEKAVNEILSELNDLYDVIYTIKSHGIYEENDHFTKRGDFLGI